MISKISFLKWLKNYMKEAKEKKYSDSLINQDLLKKINEFEDYVRYSVESEKNWEEKI